MHKFRKFVNGSLVIVAYFLCFYLLAKHGMPDVNIVKATLTLAIIIPLHIGALGLIIYICTCFAYSIGDFLDNIVIKEE